MKKVLNYRLCLTAPLILTIPGGDPNSAGTLSFIPGGAVLGALAARWLSKNSVPDPDPARDPEFRKLFLDGSVRFLNAYPEGEGESRLLPAPLSLRTKKGDDLQVFDLADPKREEFLWEEKGNQERPVALSSFAHGFVGLVEGNDKWRDAGSETRLHHQRDREAGRSIGVNDPIFSYIALSRGERFSGRVLVEEDDLSNTLQELFKQGPLGLGRSRSAQYGGQAEIVSLNEEKGETFKEAGTLNAVPQGRVVVTLVSDYLGLDENGRPDPLAFLPEFLKAAGLSQEKAKEETCVAGVRLVSGYNAKWRMPRPAHPALCAGSVFALNTKHEITQARLESLLWKGLGERRAEGFGRVAVNWHGMEDDENGFASYRPGEEEIQRETRAANGNHRDPAAQDMLGLLRRSLLLEEAELALVNAARNTGINGSLPPNSVAGRIRARLRKAANPEEVQALLTNMSGKKAGKHLRACRVGGKNLEEYIQGLMGDPATLDHALNLGIWMANVALTRDEAEVNATRAMFEELRWDLTKKFAEEVLRKVNRQNRQQERENDRREGGADHE